MKLFSYFFIFMLFVLPGQLFGGEIDDLKTAIKKNPVFAWGNVRVLEHNSTKYLVSVGGAPISSNTPRAKLKARKEAKQIAERELTHFVHGVRIQSTELLETKYEITKIIKDGKVLDLNEKESETYTEIIKANSGGVLKNVIDIGRWKSEDKKEYLYALGIQLTH